MKKFPKKGHGPIDLLPMLDYDRGKIGESEMFPVDRKPMPVSVEYDYRGGRRLKTFADPYSARRFYVTMSKMDKNPKVIRSEVMATTKKATKKATKKSAAKKATKKATKN